MKYLPLLILLAACCRCPEPDPLAYYRGYGEGVKAGADAVSNGDISGDVSIIIIDRTRTNMIRTIQRTGYVHYTNP